MAHLPPAAAVLADDDQGPTLAELAAIDAEWPAIAADLAELDRFIADLLGHPVTAPTDLDRRRARRTTRRAMIYGAIHLRAVA